MMASQLHVYSYSSEFIVITSGNPFDHLDIMKHPPCDIELEKPILTDLNDRYVLENISSRI